MLSGQTTDAVDHVRRAIELSEQFRDYARSDPDLDPIRNEPAFEALMNGQGTPMWLRATNDVGGVGNPSG